MSDPLPYKHDIPMKTRKTTKKAAAVKRKTVTPQPTYTVADLRALLQEAAGALIAVDCWLDQKVSEVAKAKR